MKLKLNQNIIVGINNLAKSLSLIIFEIKIEESGNNKILTILVDSENGISLNEVADLSRKINEYIDSEETGIEGSFRLDVSSPGVDFPLKFDWQYVRNIGRLLMLRYKDDNGETKNELFRLLDFKNNNLILVKHNPIVKGKASTKVSETIVISKDKILKAVTEVEF
ncbi:MAG: hypothetical protein IPP08_11700 [Chlorobiota bacterium]|nr:hypothetical protein [Chlorobiota bacterium]QQS67889.1 MAG: hypothetical protein IPP08_11700 [Chlorobiota bacterium]